MTIKRLVRLVTGTLREDQQEFNIQRLPIEKKEREGKGKRKKKKEKKKKKDERTKPLMPFLRGRLDGDESME